MKRFFIYSLFMLFAQGGFLHAQQIHGKVTDKAGQPVDGVAVILQTIDSTYIEAAITDTAGAFYFKQLFETGSSDYSQSAAAQSALTGMKGAGGAYRLLFQHLLYVPSQKEITSADAGVIPLTEKANELGEVTVRGERPQVSVEGNKLSYDVPQLVKNKTATNAYEVLKELPGITGQDGTLQLIGANRLHVVLNGQLTTLSLDQMIDLLKSMPASRVQKAEIMYNAPARYNMKGAVINVVLNNPVSQTPALQGEVGVDYGQAHYANGEAHANLLYSSPNLQVDVLVNGKKGRFFNGEEILARHTLAGQDITEIHQLGRNRKYLNRGTARLGLEYKLPNKDKLSATYYFSGNKSRTTQVAQTTYTDGITDKENKKDPYAFSNSRLTNHGHAALHNGRLQYDGHAGWTAGVDYTYYHTPSDQLFSDSQKQQDIDTTSTMFNNMRQKISRIAFFIDHTLNFPTGWTLSYGVHAGYTYSKNYMDYLYERGNGYELDADATEMNTQKEYNGNVFAEVSRNFGTHFSATAALKGEYFKSDYDSPQERKTLWEDWTLYPTVSLSYRFSPNHIMQLNVNSDKTYPSYWTVSPQKTPLNSYSVAEGNPTLKPYRSYEGQLVYILRQKYILLGFAEYTPDFFTQLPYQSDTELKNVFRFENMDYKWEYGLALIVPFRVGTWWNSRVTLRGWRMHEKCDQFHSISYNRKANVGLILMSNTFDLSSRPNLKLTLDGQYVTEGAIQGVYDLGSMYKIGAGLKWTFAKDRASLTLNASDIFRSGIPKARIDQGTQWTRLWKLNDERLVKLSFVWKFGNYKEKKHETIDTSRFGK